MKYIISLHNLMLRFPSSSEYSADVNGLGTLRILESIRSLNFEKK